MPYESFASQQIAQITDVYQDDETSAWMYMVRIERGNTPNAGEEDGNGFSHEYVINRRFSEFKQLHSLLAPIMGDSLSPLPADGLMTLILADNQELLKTRKEGLERILLDITSHPVAKELPEVLQFLGSESLSAKVLPPMFNSGKQYVGSMRNTSGPCWSTLSQSARSSTLVSS